MNQLHMQKQQKKNVGEMQREKKIKLLRIMGLGPWSIYHMGRKQSEASGFIRLNTTLTEV